MAVLVLLAPVPLASAAETEDPESVPSPELEPVVPAEAPVPVAEAPLEVADASNNNYLRDRRETTFICSDSPSRCSRSSKENS